MNIIRLDKPYDGDIKLIIQDTGPTTNSILTLIYTMYDENHHNIDNIDIGEHRIIVSTPTTITEPYKYTQEFFLAPYLKEQAEPVIQGILEGFLCMLEELYMLNEQDLLDSVLNYSMDQLELIAHIHPDYEGFILWLKLQ